MKDTRFPIDVAPAEGPRRRSLPWRPTLAAQQRCARIAARTQQLETGLFELLGEQAWRTSGLGAPTDIEELQRKIVFVEQQVVDLRLKALPHKGSALVSVETPSEKRLHGQIGLVPPVEYETAHRRTTLLEQPAQRELGASIKAGT